jgi:hypothetical protein
VISPCGLGFGAPVGQSGVLPDCGVTRADEVLTVPGDNSPQRGQAPKRQHALPEVSWPDELAFNRPAQAFQGFPWLLFCSAAPTTNGVRPRRGAQWIRIIRLDEEEDSRKNRGPNTSGFIRQL